jgi:tetratricopeptide (TPR) repeat protein
MLKPYWSQIVFVLSLPALLFAESITLKSGKTIEGRIIKRTDQYIKIQVDGNPLYFERKFIAHIDEKEASLLSIESASLTDKEYLKESLKYGSEARFQEAEEALRKGLTINPNSHNLHQVLNIIDELKSGQMQQDYAVRLLKGSHYLMNLQFEEAMPEFKAALKLNPNPDIYYYLGVCSYSLQEYEQAIDYLKKAAAEIKDDNEIYYNLGVSHYALRQYPQAVAYLQKALEINPEDADCYGVLGTCHLILGQKQLAREELSKSRDLFRKQGDYLKAAEVETFLREINR